MSDWTLDEVHAIGEIEEVQVSPLAGDGTPLQSVTMWAVTSGGEVFVRSVHGTKGRWHQRVEATGRGIFGAGDISKEVSFEPVDQITNRVVTDAYSAKYAAQPDQFLRPMLEGPSLEGTFKVVPV